MPGPRAGVSPLMQQQALSRFFALPGPTPIPEAPEELWQSLPPLGEGMCDGGVLEVGLWRGALPWVFGPNV